MTKTEESVRRQSGASGSRPAKRAGGAHAARASASPKASSAARKHAEGSAARRAHTGKPASPARAKGGRAAAKRSGASARGRSARKQTPRRRMKRFYARNRLLVWIAGGALVIALVAALAVLLISGRGGSEEPAADASAAPSTSASAQVLATPTPAPTPESTQTPEPTDTPEPTIPPEEMFALCYPTDYSTVKGTMQTDRALGLPEGEEVDDSFFDDACFVGDSVTLGLRQYVVKMRKSGHPNLLGKAIFLASGSFRIQDTLGKVTKTSKHPTYKGKKMPLEDVLAKRGIKKVYLMLGLNDVAGVGADKTVANMGTLVSRIQEKNPGIQIFIESVTPRMHGVEPATGTLFKYDIHLYEQLLKAQLPDVYFVDVAYVMRTASGYLREEYCSDPGGMAMHFNENGCKEWIKYLYTHTPPTVASVRASDWTEVQEGAAPEVFGDMVS